MNAMKILLVYHSFTGHTHEVAQKVERALGKGATVHTVRVEPERDMSYIVKSLASILGRSPPLKTEEIKDGYDCVVIGFPVWFVSPSAYFNSLLKLLTFKGKCILFCSYEGSGAERALKVAAKRCAEKGFEVVHTEAFKEGEDHKKSVERIAGAVK